MGCNFGNDYTTENDAENLFIQIISSFNSLSNYNKPSFLSVFSLCKVTTKEKRDNIEEIKSTYLSTDYDDKFVKSFIQNNHLSQFHSSLFPEFDDINENNDDPEYNILQFGLGFFKESNKFQVVYETIKDNLIYLNEASHIECKVTVKHVLDFIEKYFQKNLYELTKRLSLRLKDFQNMKIEGTDFFVDDAFLGLAQFSLGRFEKKEYFLFTKERILEFLGKNLKKKKENEELIHEEVSKEIIDRLNSEFGYIFEILNMRKDAWLYYKKIGK